MQKNKGKMRYATIGVPREKIDLHTNQLFNFYRNKEESMSLRF
jgi:hypothetical protein